MHKIILFDPAMCCSSGVCGCSADPERSRVAAVLENLKKLEIDVARYNLSADPKAFMQNEAVSDVLYQSGAEALPITVVDGKIVKSGSYPTNEEFARLLDIPVDAIKPALKVKVKKHGCGTEGCC